MQFSIIIASYNRAHAIPELLDSIAASIRAAGAENAVEIVLVDNRSTDDTAAVIDAWKAANPAIELQHLYEPVQGCSRARNRGIASARGTLLAFTDDDCRPALDYVAKALAYDATDSEALIRGGRIELSDATDLPLTIKTEDAPEIWSIAQRSARSLNLADSLAGCNMTMRKSTAQELGGFDIRFGPGTKLLAAEDSDLYYRAYLKGMKLVYAPDLLVMHDHGRKSNEDGFKLMRSYCIGNGALFAKYLFWHPDFCRPLYWDMKNALREIFARRTLYMPQFDFSYMRKLRCYALGMLLYVKVKFSHLFAQPQSQE